MSRVSCARQKGRKAGERAVTAGTGAEAELKLAERMSRQLRRSFMYYECSMRHGILCRRPIQAAAEESRSSQRDYTESETNDACYVCEEDA